MPRAARGSLFFALGVCAAWAFSAYAVEDTDVSSLIQSKVDLPKDQDDLDLEAAEAEISQEQRRAAMSPPKIVQHEAAPMAAAAASSGISDEQAQDAADAELEAMQAEESLESDGQEDEAEESEEDEEQGAEDEEQEPEFDPEKAKQALRERIAERAKLAQANNYSFTVGSTVFVAGKKGKIVWDGRPDHDFVKITWLEGPHSGKSTGIVSVDDCSLEAQKTVEVGTGRHLKKRVASAAQLQQKKRKAPKVKDTSRRRRSVLRRIVYGIKKMPMVVQIPFKGLKTGVETITSEMTAHTGLAFNGSLIDLLNVGSGNMKMFKDDVSDQSALEASAQKAAHRKPRRNITDIVRNKTVAAVMKIQDKHLRPLMTAFTNEIRIPELGSDLGIGGNFTFKNLDPALAR